MSELSERRRRWRLVLGAGGEDVDGGPSPFTLEGIDASRDATLNVLYGDEGERGAGLGKSSPRVARWLGDIRTYFPTSVVQVMQRDAMDRLGRASCCWNPRCWSPSSPTSTSSARCWRSTGPSPSGHGRRRGR